MEAVDRDLPKDAGEGRLSEWFVLHSPALRAFFAKKAGGANAADLVQEVFICLQTRAVAEDVEDVERYLFKVAHNVLASHRRGLRRRDRVLAAPSGDFDVAGQITDERSPERIVQAKLDLARLGAAIRALPPRTQAAFLMHRFD
jgi:RNA polymerase sigma factor (sigma-70 family)